MTWAINREMVVIAGWGRAILLQLAHPAVAAGIRDHSSFRGSLTKGAGRLSSTVGAMLSLTFGTDEEAIGAAAHINAIHDRVSGPGYSAHDPDLLRWVHATLLDSIPMTYERLVRTLTSDERDRYCTEAAIMEPLMGMPAGWLPRDAARLDAYMHDMISGGSLVVTDAAREIARAVLYPPRWYVAWPAFRPMQLLTIGSLPPSIRRAYGFEWSGRDARAFARWTAVLRTALRLLPPIARQWPVARRAALASRRNRESAPRSRESAA